MKLFLFVMCTLALAACQMSPCGLSKDKFLDNYDSFVDDVADLELDFEAKAWDKYDDKFERFTEECYPKYEDKMSGREQRQFASNTVRFVALRYGKSALQGDELKENMREFGEKLGELADKLGEEGAKLINDFMNEIDRESVEKAFQDLKNFFEGLDWNIDLDSDK